MALKSVVHAFPPQHGPLLLTVKVKAHALATKPFVLDPFFWQHSSFHFPCLLPSPTGPSFQLPCCQSSKGPETRTMTQWAPNCRCTRKGQCRKAAQPNQWLWSYEEDNHCLHVQSLLPTHHPRQEQSQVRLMPLPACGSAPRLPPSFSPAACAPSHFTLVPSPLASWPPGKPLSALLSLHVPQVTLSVPRLPTLAVDEYFHCAFGDYDSLAHVEGPHVACVTPPEDQLPLNPPGTGEGSLGRVPGAGAEGAGTT